MHDPLPFADTVVNLEEVFRPCLVTGQVVVAHRKAPSRAPDPFARTQCECGEERSRIVSFWLDDRLWCVDFCLRCSLGHNTGVLQSLARADVREGFLAPHTVVTVTQDRPFLVDESHPAWKQALAAAGMADWRAQEQAEVWEAVAVRFGCGNGPSATEIRSHFRGSPAWIQWPMTGLTCSKCLAPMAFLAQISQDLGFHWGDAGDAYVFRCPEHPEEGVVVAQMC